MGIKDKQTYGEYYWAMQVEAQNAADEQIESAFAPYFAGILSDLPDMTGLPIGIQTLVNVLAEPPSAGFGGFALGVGVEMIDEVLHSTMNPAMKMLTRTINRNALETWLTGQQATTLFQRGKITEGLWAETVRSEGYEDVLGKFVYQSQLPYPSIPDIMRFARYTGDPDNIKERVWEFFDVPAGEFDIWEFQTRSVLSSLDSHTAYRRGIITEQDYYMELARLGWFEPDRPTLEQLGWTIPNAMLLVQGDLLQENTDDNILKDISLADINPEYAQKYLDAVLTKPASQDIIAYQLRRDPELSDLEGELRKIGIHPKFNELYKTLAYQIPPVADIITMAVREAFTPTVAAKFGQYEDFPEDFAKFAAMKGLSHEWAERYWAAHWNLPSPQQGFEMLHRGIIEEPELLMLMKALDIMPFWRDKLMQMSYRRLTRVDVRRMYRVGVLTEAEVYEAYLQQGYNPENARRMSDFTIKQTLETLSKFTASDVVNAFTKRMISRSEAQTILRDIGIRSEDATYILSTAEYKRTWALTDSKIRAVSNLYRKGVYDENDARDKLSRLDLPSEQIDVLLEQWYHDKIAEPTNTWTTAQTLAYLKKKLITEKRAKTELHLNGYDTEHIDVYLRSVK